MILEQQMGGIVTISPGKLDYVHSVVKGVQPMHILKGIVRGIPPMQLFDADRKTSNQTDDILPIKSAYANYHLFL